MSNIIELLTAGVQALQGGKISQAKEKFETVLSVQPQNVDALNFLGVVECQIGNFTEAINYLEQATSLAPNASHVFNNLGNAYKASHQLKLAFEAYQTSITLEPGNIEAIGNLGVVFKLLRNFEQAIPILLKAIELNPAFYLASLSLAEIYLEQKKYVEVLDLLLPIPQAQLNNFLPFKYLGRAYFNLNQFEKSIEVYHQALNLYPKDITVLNNLGMAYLEVKDLLNARTYYEKALEIDKEHVDINYSYAITLLKLGNFIEGFNYYEYRWKTNNLRIEERYFKQPQWKGQSLNGQTIFLHAEQGYGDSIQFIRYAEYIHSQYEGKVIAMVQPPLVKLFQQAKGVELVLPWGASIPHFDVQAPFMSLPRIMQTTAESIPANTPYFDVEVPQTLPESRVNTLKVGLVWASGLITQNDLYRVYEAKSCSLEQLLPAINLSGTQLYSLQVGPDAEDIIKKGLSDKIIDLTPLIDSFLDTAHLIQQLDLVISIDTAVAHLAGALNKPVWTLLSYNSDWRWLENGEELSSSSWYPTMKLFRQKAPNDWNASLIEIRENLKILL